MKNPLTLSSFSAALAAYLAAEELAIRDRLAAFEPAVPATLSPVFGGRYVRLVRTDGDGEIALHGLVDTMTGEVIGPGGQSRGSIGGVSR